MYFQVLVESDTKQGVSSRKGGTSLFFRALTAAAASLKRYSVCGKYTIGMTFNQARLCILMENATFILKSVIIYC